MSQNIVEHIEGSLTMSQLHRLAKGSFQHFSGKEFLEIYPKWDKENEELSKLRMRSTPTHTHTGPPPPATIVISDCNSLSTEETTEIILFFDKFSDVYKLMVMSGPLPYGLT